MLETIDGNSHDENNDGKVEPRRNKRERIEKKILVHISFKGGGGGGEYKTHENFEFKFFRKMAKR